MAIAAIAHVFIFSAKPYHYLPTCEYGKMTTQAKDDDENPAAIEKTETEVKASGTSVKESVQDIVLEGVLCSLKCCSFSLTPRFCSIHGGLALIQVVKDVVLAINQAFELVEKGVTKMQETFHRRTVGSNGSKDVSELEVEQDIELTLAVSDPVPSSSETLVAETNNQTRQLPKTAKGTTIDLSYRILAEGLSYIIYTTSVSKSTSSVVKIVGLRCGT
ncbi:hypothetical protein RJ641_026652 [Dillenia turbinata]|uniref:Uncharacterized protein n=1 Tax=Dillenia turbinata TaxID=194707 RepID=A0AAN8VWN3_9MAGN